MASILVIEDDRASRENLLELLDMEGFDVIGAENGVVGIRLAREHLPKLIICDIMMPDLDGYGVLKALRCDSMTATIPFIFLTGKSDRHSIRQGMQLGADDYIFKPYDTHELLAAINTRFVKQGELESQRLRMQAWKLVEVQEIERNRIARELYDEVSQPLTGLRFLLDMVGQVPPETAAIKLVEVQTLADDLMQRVAMLSHRLRPVMLDYLGLIPTLLWYFEQYSAQSQVHVTFKHADVETRMQPELETAIYRIVQEALNNIAQHAGVSDAYILLQASKNTLYLVIEDGGIGFAVDSVMNSGVAIGLSEMFERARALEGQLAIESRLGLGTRITATLPLVVKQIEATVPSTAAPAIRSPAQLQQSAFIRQGNSALTQVPSKEGTHHRHHAPGITIVLVDSHDIVCQGLKALLEMKSGFSVIGEADNGLDAADLVEKLQPDVLLLELMLPGLSGLDVTRQVRQRSPNTKVLMLSTQTHGAYVQEALRNGAAGFALKSSSVTELLQAVQDVASGRHYLSPLLSQQAIEFYGKEASAEDAAADPYRSLTDREREIFHLAAEGYKNAELADRLSISPRTVETHRANLMRKLGLRTQTDLVRYAIRRGILPLDE